MLGAQADDELVVGLEVDEPAGVEEEVAGAVEAGFPRAAGGDGGGRGVRESRDGGRPLPQPHGVDDGGQVRAVQRGVIDELGGLVALLLRRAGPLLVELVGDEPGDGGRHRLRR